MINKVLHFIAIILLCCIGLSACTKTPPEDDGKDKDNDPEQEIVGYGKGEIVISVFWPPMKGFTTEEQFDYLVEGGIDLLE